MPKKRSKIDPMNVMEAEKHFAMAHVYRMAARAMLKHDSGYGDHTATECAKKLLARSEWETKMGDVTLSRATPKRTSKTGNRKSKI